MRRPRGRGFILIVVLLVLTLAATVLSATASYSSRQALAASRAVEALQLRWGQRSCAEAFLGDAERLIKQQAAYGAGPASSARFELELAGAKYRLILSDEQSKVNVNLLASRVSKEVLAARIRALGALKHAPLNILLRPDQPAASRSTARRATRFRRLPVPRASERPEPMTVIYSSLDQIYQYDHPRQLVALEYGEVANDRITCWGDGRINFKRAEGEVLHEALKGAGDATMVDKIIAFRSEHPDGTLGELLAALKPARAQAARLRETLTDASTCHGLWIVVEGSTRSWYRFHVIDAERSGAGGEGEWDFQW